MFSIINSSLNYRKAITVLVMRFLSAILSYAVVVVFARVLEPIEYGHFSLIISAMTIGAVFCKLGTDVLLIRYLGEYRPKKLFALSNGLIHKSLFTVALTTLFVVFLVAVYSYSLENIYYVIAAIFIFPAFVITDVLGAVIRSYGGLISAIGPKEVLWRCALIILVVSGSFYGMSSRESLTISLLGSGIVLAILVPFQIKRQRRLKQLCGAVTNESQIDRSEWLTTGMPLWFLLCSRVLVRLADVIIVGIILSVELAGVYFAVSRVAELISFVLSTVNTIIGPAVARGYSAGKIDKTQEKLSFVALFLLISSCLLLLIFLIWGKEILSFINPNFVQFWPLLLILSFGQFINVAVGGAGVVLNMTGHEKVNGKILISTAPIILISMFVTTKLFGIYGAAIASSIGYIVWNFRLWKALRTFSVFDTSFLSISKIIKY
jgi:O-antigen/teichoic acid export membrane protein